MNNNYREEIIEKYVKNIVIELASSFEKCFKEMKNEEIDISSKECALIYKNSLYNFCAHMIIEMIGIEKDFSTPLQVISRVLQEIENCSHNLIKELER